MAHLQYMPGDQGLIDQLVYELKSKGIFDQFRKDCIADVDTRPAYQNLRQRVESSVTTFLSHQKWKPDLNKNQLREKLRKHILDGNYLEQGVERIVDQVVNPKVASVFIPQVEDLVYNYLGIKRNNTAAPNDSSNGKCETNDLLPTDLEAVSPGSVKSNNDKEEAMDISAENTSEAKVDGDEDHKSKMDIKDESMSAQDVKDDTQLSGISDLTSPSSNSLEISVNADIKSENIPTDINQIKIDVDQIPLPKVCDIPLPTAPKPEELLAKEEKECYFKPVSDDDDVSSNSSDLRLNMSPLTPVRNFDDENSCDAKQGFDDATEAKLESKQEVSVTDFNFELKPPEVKTEKKDTEQSALSYQFENQVNINTYNTPLYEDSSNSNNLHIDYESDANSKTNTEKIKPELDQISQDVKKEKTEDKKSSSHKSSHKSRDSHRHTSSSKDRRSESKHSSNKDKRDDKKSSRDDHSKKSSHRERSRDRSDKKESRDSSKHSSSHKSSSSHKDSKSHKSSSSSQRHSSKHDDKKSSTSSSSHRDRSDKSSSKDHRSSRDTKSSSQRSDKDKKSSRSSSSSKNDKDKDKKEKKTTDDHYSLSRRGNNSRRSTDRDSNDGNSTSPKGSNNNLSKAADSNKKEKTDSSKSGTGTSSSTGTSPSDNIGNDKVNQAKDGSQRPVVRIENHLETPVQKQPARFMPEVVLKKPKFASNFEEARQMMKMRKFLDDEQRKMNQEAALLLEFQANVRPSLSQVYSNISGPELEFACVNNEATVDDGEVIEEAVEIEHEFEETIQEEPYEMEFEEIDSETIESIAEIQKEVDNITNDIEEEKMTGDAQNKIVNKQFEVTITSDEDISDSDINQPMVETQLIDKNLLNDIIGVTENSTIEITEETAIEITVEHLIDSDDSNSNSELHYFDDNEKQMAECYKNKYAEFLKSYTDKHPTKLFLINCNSYYKSLIDDVSKAFGNFHVVTYDRNGHTNLPKLIDFSNKEIMLPFEMSKVSERMFSPVKSECSFELSSDYDAKLDEMINTTSRQQIMEIILGGAIEESPTKLPRIDICKEINFEMGNVNKVCKRRYSDIESSDNNNIHILTPSKIRRTSESDQITSTTEDSEEILEKRSNDSSIVRSKYLGKARRVGLPKPRKSLHSNSPSSDKSVENYELNGNTSTSPVNGKMKMPRNKIQRYDTSDLYKPKLHFLSRRNNVS